MDRDRNASLGMVRPKTANNKEKEVLTQLHLELLLRDAGMASAENAASDAWKARAVELIEQFSASYRPFTANQVRESLQQEGYDLDHRCAMGGLFVKAARAGLIEGIGFTKNNITGGHAGHLKIWMGT